MSPREVVLIANEPLSPAVRRLRFRTLDAAPWHHEPGQWVNVSLPGHPEIERRAYSIASVAQGAELTLAVTHVDGGQLSPLLHALVPGDQALVDGPHGFFVREHSAEPALFVAAGSGLAPIRAMLQAAFAEGEGVPAPPALTLLFGCRTPQDVLFAEDLQHWVAQQKDFELHLTLSRADDSWQGPRGYVQQHVAGIVARRPVSHVYICGLSAMVREVRAVLKPLGLGRGRVHTERYD